MTDAAVAAARALLADARGVVVLTGAGISAESGVPTFRGEQGLWRSHRPEELATPEAFRRDPDLVWTWYAWRRRLVAACRPNPGHEALARAALTRGDVRIVTQNVDGLHEVAARDAAAGRDPSPALPLELHGTLFGDRCQECGRRSSGRSRSMRGPPPGSQVPHTADLADVHGVADVAHARPAAGAEAADDGPTVPVPRCEACGGRLRPDVVWFGEGLDPDVLDGAFEAARSAQVCVVAGTSAVVHPAASIPLATRRQGGALIEVNPEPTPLSEVCDVVLRGPSGALLPALFA